MKDKFTWGAIVKPTKSLVKTELIKEDDYGISLGQTKDKQWIVVIKSEKKTPHTYHPSFWELLEI